MNPCGLATIVFGALLAMTGCSGEEEHATPASPQEASAHPAARHAAENELPRSAASLPDGYAVVELDADRVQMFGLRSEPAAKTALTREVRTVGVVRTDETRESHIHVKWMGWIEEFFVSYVGQSVKRGDPLFSVYSPDLVTAQQELLVAKARFDSAERSQRTGDLPSARSLLETARTKLQLFDVSRESIAAI